MNIALIGYGRMGKEIEKIAMERNHAILYRINSASGWSGGDLKNVDVAIEFTRPDVAADNIRSLLNNNITTISGTTGWNELLDEVKTLVRDKNCAFLHSSNFSIGVNIFFEINRKLASIMNQFADYDVSMEEIHHTKKLDAPSGTAVTLAEDILKHLKRKSEWVSAKETNKQTIITIDSIRKDDVPGTHKVKYFSAIDDIEIIHTAHSRTGFAKGAVMAAEWIKDKKGFYSMQDFLKF